MEKVRFVTIGTNITDTFLKAARTVPEFELAAVYSRSEERAREFAGRHQVSRYFTDLEEMAKWDGYEAVYVGAPIAFHYPYARLFLEHGKHVLLEKAFTANGEQARKLVDLAREKKLLLMEAMMTTRFPNFFQIRDNLPKLGKIRRYVANFGVYSVRYDDYKAGKQVNTFRRDLCNGALLDMGVYCVAPMVALFGKPQEVKAFGVVLDSGVDGQSTIICRYPGMDAVNLVTKIADSYLPSEIAGEEGTMFLDHIQKLQVIEIRYRDGRTESIRVEQQEMPMVYELQDFIRTLREGRRDSCLHPMQLSLDIMEVLDEVRKQTGVFYDCDKREEESL